MATERKPWPAWAADTYYSLYSLTRQADKWATEALESQHLNVYKTARLLSLLHHTGQKISGLLKEFELYDSQERIPKWVAGALTTTRISGKYITAGAKHGLDGIEQDNWKMVLKGVNTCLDHIHKIETALKSGPQPTVEFLPDHLARTLDMGDFTPNKKGGGKWRRNKM